jgi:multiple sugar transport system substrate-binding protein
VARKTFTLSGAKGFQGLISTRRSLILMGGAGSAAVLLSACGAGAAGTGTKTDTAPARTPVTQGVVIRFQAKDTAPDSVAYMEQLVKEDFEPAHPGAKVEIELPTTAYFPKLLAHLAAGTEPDTARIDEYYIPSLVAKDSLKPLEPYSSLDKQFDSKALFAIPWQAGQYRSHFYGLTTGPNGYFIVFNKTAFEEAGLKPPPSDPKDQTWTWERMRDDARRLTRQGATGQDTRFGFMWDVSLLSRLSAQVNAAAGKIVDTLQDPKKGALDDQRTVALLQLLQDMRHRDRSLPMDDDIKGQGEGAQLVAKGRVAMAVSLTNVGQTLKDAPFTWDFAPLPRPNGGGPANTALITNVYSMFKSSKNPEVAWDWIRIMGSPKHALWHVKNKEFLPGWKSLREEYSKLRPPEHRAAALDLAEYGTPSINSVKYVELQDLIKEGLAPVWNGTAPAKQTVDQLMPRINALFA